MLSVEPATLGALVLLLRVIATALSLPLVQRRSEQLNFGGLQNVDRLRDGGIEPG